MGDEKACGGGAVAGCDEKYVNIGDVFLQCQDQHGQCLTVAQCNPQAAAAAEQSSAWKGTKNDDNFWVQPSSALGGSTTMAFLYKASAGRAGFTNYMMWSSRMSFLIPGDGSNMQVNCWRSGVWHRGSSSGHSTLRDNKWHEFFFVYQGSTVTLYVDGKRVMSNGACGDWKSKWRFGNHAAEFSKMSLWKRTLSSSEIADGKMLCKDDEDLVSRYQLADATDEKGNGNDLEMNGGSFLTSDYTCPTLSL